MPTGPCFIVGPEGYFSLAPDFPSQQRATLLGAINGFFQKCTVFDSAGSKWQTTAVESPYRRSWWTILLANTVYNPRIAVAVLWGEPKRYSLDELKRAYADAVDKDDDVLTQFVEAAELKAWISAARSFDELVGLYRRTETDDAEQTT